MPGGVHEGEGREMLLIGKNIKAARRAKGMTQSQLAAAAGICEKMIWEYETGRVNPQLETAALLAGALGITLDEMIKRKETA